MMTRLQYLLNKLAEEASEVSQIALKTAQFGLDECKQGQELTNAQRTHSELNDLLAIVDMLNREFGFGFFPSDISQMRKQAKVEQFYQYSVELGFVEGCLHQRSVTHYTGDGTPVNFCPDCGRNEVTR